MFAQKHSIISPCFPTAAPKFVACPNWYAKNKTPEFRARTPAWASTGPADQKVPEPAPLVSTTKDFPPLFAKWFRQAAQAERPLEKVDASSQKENLF